jgi:GcrA cell cycle regulator
MTRHADIWTPEAVSELGTLWLEGVLTGEIAERLGVSKNAVVGKAHRLGLPPRENPVDRSKIKTAVAPGPAGCRFIAGDDYLERQRRGEEIFCRRPVVAAGMSWCAEHMQIVYVRHTAAHRWFNETMDRLSPSEMALYRKLRAEGVQSTAALKKAAVA